MMGANPIPEMRPMAFTATFGAAEETKAKPKYKKFKVDLWATDRPAHGKNKAA